MPFLAFLMQLLNDAAVIIPVVSAVRQSANPELSSAPIDHVSQIISQARVVVNAGEQASAAAVAAGNPAFTGVQKLQLAQDVVQDLHTKAVAAGATTASFDSVWLPINTAITQICTAQKPQPVNAYVANFMSNTGG